MRDPRTAVRRAVAVRVIGVLAAAVLVAALAGCSGDDRPTSPLRAAQAIGQGEGVLTLVAWSGYTEDGSSDSRVDWVKPFEERTDCKVSVKYAATTQDMVDLMSNPGRRYDGVSAPPEVAGRLIAARQAAPVNPDLVDGFKDLEPTLRAQLKRGGKYYGVPFVWGTNLLMYDPKTVQPVPDSWAALFDPGQAKKYSGRLVVRDSPLTIGDAALYLKSRDPSLGIGDPFTLNRKQLDAAAELIAKQHPMVDTYWFHPSDAIDAFADGGAALGQVWPYHVDVLTRAGRSVAGARPREGITGWLDAWMIGARAEHPNCMYEWLNWMTTPDVQQQVAEWDGVAPANPQACTRDRLSRQFCRAYHVGDETYLDTVVFARAPTTECGDATPPDSAGDGRKDCTDYSAWAAAWGTATRR